MCKRIKQSDWPWKFWGCRVFHYSWVGLVLSLSVTKWPNLLDHFHLKWLKVLLLFLTTFKKTNFITQLILEIKLTICCHFGHVQACLSTPTWSSLLVAVWWYFLVRLWVKLFVSQGLIQAFFGLFDGHKWFTASTEKNQLGAKSTKMGTPPLIIAV